MRGESLVGAITIALLPLAVLAPDLMRWGGITRPAGGMPHYPASPCPSRLVYSQSVARLRPPYVSLVAG